MSKAKHPGSSTEMLCALADALQERIEAAGFKRTAKIKFTRRTADKSDVILFHSRRLGTGTGDRLWVTPVVQANFPSVMKIADAIRGTKGIPTAGGVLGRFSPKRSLIEWPLTSPADVPAVADDLWDAIKRWGYPFWESTSSVAATLQAAEEQRISAPPYWVDRAAMIYMLRGTEAAVQFIHSVVGANAKEKGNALSVIESLG